jgi:pyridoxal phosphate enzyme (YggS family)
VKASTIAERLEAVRERVAVACERSGRPPDGVTIVAVTKGFPRSAVAEAVAAGLRHVGENRVQEAATKCQVDLSPRPTWHLVGHLQTNKVKTALELFDIIHSVDSLHLAEAISGRAQRLVPVLLEVNVAGAATKFGFSPETVAHAVEEMARLPGLELRGLMTVAPLAAAPEEVRPVFRRLCQLRDALGLKELSMGMTDDFEVAIEEGATLVRIGRAIFGERPT